MNPEVFEEASTQITRFITRYLSDEYMENRPVIPRVEPGFMKSIIPLNPPKESEPWSSILYDMEDKIMPGITHWQHPGFFAYYPAGNSYPSILADMISDGIGCQGFSWAASPASTELETIMMDWLAKMLNLPKMFLYHEPNSNGGGVLQGSASQCILVAMLTARKQALDRLKIKYPETCPGSLLFKLVAYCSNLAHSSVKKAATICFVNIRTLETDNNYSMRGITLEKAIKEDIAKGYHPFMVIGTLGTTSCCSFDNLKEIGDVGQIYNLWFHVDAAYAGSALVCPEFTYLLDGIENVDSFDTNPNKWMLTCFDCSALWVKNRWALINAMSENPFYLQHKNSNHDEAIDYRNWDISLSRRFRSLKLWFVIRTYGISGIQKHIRNHVRLAKLFEQLVKTDSKFELIGEVILGLICFRLKGSNELNKRFLECLNDSGKIHLTPALLENFSKKDKSLYVIRFVICRENAVSKDIYRAWKIIKSIANRLLNCDKRVSMMDELYSYDSTAEVPLNKKILKQLLKRYCGDTFKGENNASLPFKNTSNLGFYSPETRVRTRMSENLQIPAADKDMLSRLLLQNFKELLPPSKLNLNVNIGNDKNFENHTNISQKALGDMLSTLVLDENIEYNLEAKNDDSSTIAAINTSLKNPILEFDDILNADSNLTNDFLNPKADDEKVDDFLLPIISETNYEKFEDEANNESEEEQKQQNFLIPRRRKRSSISHFVANQFDSCYGNTKMSTEFIKNQNS